MYRLIFYYDNNMINGKLIDLNNDITYLNTNKCIKIIDELIKDNTIIKDIKINDSINFNIDNLNVTLRNKDKFKTNDLYVTISKKIKEKKYKIIKKTIIGTTAIGLSSIILLSVLYNCKNNVIKYETSNKTYSDSNNELVVNNNYVDDNITQKTEKNENINEINNIIITFNIGSKIDSKDVNITRNLYYDIIKSYCEKYSINSDVICALATQEQGVHNPNESGTAIGLMQIEKVHIGETIRLYNYETNEYETIKITEDNLRNLDTNILIGIGIFQNCLIEFNGNYFIALEAYNKGIYGMHRILKRCATDIGMTEEELINDKTNTIWCDYITSEDRGDINYLNHVLRYLPKESVKNIVDVKIKLKGNSK